MSCFLGVFCSVYTRACLKIHSRQRIVDPHSKSIEIYYLQDGQYVLQDSLMLSWSIQVIRPAICCGLYSSAHKTAPLGVSMYHWVFSMCSPLPCFGSMRTVCLTDNAVDIIPDSGALTACEEMAVNTFLQKRSTYRFIAVWKMGSDE